MEFNFEVTNVLKCDKSGFAIIDAQQQLKYRKSYSQNMNQYANQSRTIFSSQNNFQSPSDSLEEVIDKMGKASANAQKLPQQITISMKFFNSDNRIYIKADGNKALGFLKVGKRNLFIRNDYGQIKEIKPLCVLDFYVHESVQREGHGKQLFDLMLETENVSPAKLGYDRPSSKLLAFCAKHFGLKKYVPQNNNFVVFDAYWENGNSNKYNIQSQNQQPMIKANQQIYNNKNSEINNNKQNFENDENKNPKYDQMKSNQQSQQDFIEANQMQNKNQIQQNQLTQNSSKQQIPYYENFKKQNNQQAQDQYNIRQNYIQNLQSKVEHRGINKRFSNDYITSIIYQNDFPQPEKPYKVDSQNLKVKNLTNKINQNEQYIAQKEKEVNDLNQKAMEKNRAATSSQLNTSTFYKNQNQEQNNPDNLRSTNFMDVGHKLILQQNKTSYQEQPSGNNQFQRNRAENDKNIVQYQNRGNQGEKARAPWDTGFQSQNLTSNQMIGSHYNQKAYNSKYY